MISVLLADDQALVRAGFRALLNAEPDIEVVAEATDGIEAVRLARQTRPDVVLMDIRMPGVDGLEATRRIAADTGLADTKVVILTTFELDEYVFEALRTGASGFLVKDTEPVDLLRGIRAVAAGDALLSPSVTRRVIGEFAAAGARGRPAAPPRELEQLTDREREVMVLGRRGPVERRDRGPAGDQPGHRQDPRQPHHGQARRARPGAAGGLRVRGRPDPPGWLT
jgi:DNA-binding NarL/FixJ family response regulator